LIDFIHSFLSWFGLVRSSFHLHFLSTLSLLFPLVFSLVLLHNRNYFLKHKPVSTQSAQKQHYSLIFHASFKCEERKDVLTQKQEQTKEHLTRESLILLLLKQQQQFTIDFDFSLLFQVIVIALANFSCSWEKLMKVAIVVAVVEITCRYMKTIKQHHYLNI
jgi:hypothetical protein